MNPANELWYKFCVYINETAKLIHCFKTKNLTDMKNLEFIASILLTSLLAACSGSQHGKKDACATSKNSKHQKTQTFIAPPPQTQMQANAETAKQTDDSRAFTYDKSLKIDTSAHFEISKYAYYEVTDSNQRQVRPELIEKYRRARNSNTYVNLYPTDWAGIMKDRGLKPVKEKKVRVRKQRRQNYYYGNNYYGSNYNGGNYYRPRGWGLFPILSYGWNSQTGWSPNVGVAVGPRSGWGPYGAATWGGRRRGMNYSMGMPMYYNNNMYYGNNNMYHPYGYYGNQYGNSYYNNVYHYVTPVAPIVQSNAASSTVQNSDNVKNIQNTNNTSKESTTDWSDGVGGPEKYTSKTKKIGDYKVE